MATKKFKSDVSLEQALKLPNKTANRALIIDGSGALVESAVTSAELGHMSGVTSAVQIQMDAKADLVGGKIPSSQLPAIAVTEVFTAATIAARDLLTIGAGDGEVQEGDVVIVTDASADPAITSGSASYIYNGASYSLLKAGDEILTVNGQTGTVVLDADDISDAATVNKFATAAQLLKVDQLTVTQPVDLDQMEIDVAANNAKISADGSVTSHSDVTDAGSGIIISAAERTNLSNQSGVNTGDEVAASETVQGIVELATVVEIDAQTDTTRAITPAGLAGSALANEVSLNTAKVSADGSVTSHSDVTDAGSGAIITGAERTTLGTALQPADASTELNHAQTTPADWTVATGATVGAHLDEAGSRIKTLEDAPAGSAGDIAETSFTGANGVISPSDVLGLAFANATVRSFKAQVTVERLEGNETFELMGIQLSGSWEMAIEAVGPDSGVSFSITSLGQVQYVSSLSGNIPVMKFRANTLTV